MPTEVHPDIWGLIGAVFISILSGLVSLTARMAKGHPFNFFWIASEMGAAMLVGYLVYDVYPIIQKDLPLWMTQPICVAFSAHLGGRIFQWLEFKAKEKFDIRLPEQD